MTLSSGSRGALAAAAGAVAALALAAPAAHAADTCPNAAVRAQQNATYLPDCRAYELVSPVDKEGQQVRSTPTIAPDGSVAVFRANGAMAGTRGIVTGDYVARRTGDGWVTTSYIPALTGGLRLAALPDGTYANAFDEQFDEALISTPYPFDPDDQGRIATGYLGDDIFRWRPGAALSWLTRPVPAPDLGGTDTSFMWASPDLDRVLVRSARVLSTELASPPSEQYYLYADGRPADLVSEDDGGAPLALPTPNVLQQLAVSADAGTIALRDLGGRLWVRTDATDPALAATIAPRWGPQRRACEDSGAVIALSGDGRELLFQCNTPLRTGDGLATIYRGDLETGAIVAVAPAGDVWGASRDLRKLLMVSMDAVSGLDSRKLLYVDEDGVREVFDTGATDIMQLRQTAFSADARQVVFSTPDSLGFPDGGFEQVYRYDAGSDGRGVLECISCHSGGRAATGLSSLDPRMISDSFTRVRRGAISADGRRVFFTSANALVPRDVNNQPDAYMWQDGEVQLLGPGDDRLGTAFTHASQDGETAFLYSSENLVPQDVDNGVADVYAVRVGGGFLAQDAPAPCTSGCQGPLPQLEPLQSPGTVVFTGPGDRDDAAEPAVVKVFGVAGIGTRARAAWARGGRAAVRVRLSHAGTASAVMRARIGRRSVVVSRASRRAAGGGTVALSLRLSRRARSVLRRQGALRTTVRVSVPGAGGAQSASFVLRVAKKGGR